MTSSPAGRPSLDSRRADAMLAELLARQPGYVPEWLPAAEGPGWAVLQIFARYLQALTERIDEAPDKGKLAFLDMFGISLLPAQAARTPAVFRALPFVGDSRVPAHTRLGASVPGQAAPLVFETERTIGLASAQLAEVVSVWPGRDSYADHSADAVAGNPFTLFEPAQPVPHEFYLAHDTLLALSGQAIVEVRLELTSSASEALTLAWEYWDGAVWRGFDEFQETDVPTQSFDGTRGLTRSGVIRLVADCVETARTTINGVESYWIRGRLTGPLPPGKKTPQVEHVELGSALVHPLGQWIASSSDGAKLAPHAIELRFVSGGPLLSETPAPLIVDAVAELWGAFGLVHQEDVGTKSAVTWADLPFGQYQIDLTGPGFPVLHMEAKLSETDPSRSFEVAQQRAPAPLTGLAAYTGSEKLDLDTVFFPFGQQPQLGTTFHLALPESIGKPGAQLTFAATHVATPQDHPASGSTSSNDGDVVLVGEYWDGAHWAPLLDVSSDVLRQFVKQGKSFSIILPSDLTATVVNGQKRLWLRVRIRSGGFYRSNVVTWTDAEGNPSTIVTVETVPPALADLRLGCEYHAPPEPPGTCVTYSDFRWADHTSDSRWRGHGFAPFLPVEDVTPTLFLGFDRPLPPDLISLYLDVQEVAGRAAGEPLRCEYWSESDSTWLALSVQDETRHLALPGMLALLWPGDTGASAISVLQADGTQVQLADARQERTFTAGDRVYLAQEGAGELATVASVGVNALILTKPLRRRYLRGTISPAPLARFGTPRTWIRARLQTDSEPSGRVNGIYLNGVWASQTQLVENEVVGSSTGQGNQVFFLRKPPVLADEIIEVRELDGLRAPVELPMLREEALKHGLIDADIRTASDRRTGRLDQVWVRWAERPNLFFSGPEDRHYVLERSRGRLAFGDGLHGRIPPAGADNLRADTYRTGGGVAGNVPAGAVAQVLAGVLAQGVSNPRGAEGGADGEVVEHVQKRGPGTFRHRRQALTLADYEALACEASPAVAVARALPTTDLGGRHASGWVTVLIVPQSREPQPKPSFELRREVRDFLAVRAPAGLADRIVVGAPRYLPVGIQAAVTPNSPDAAGAVYQAVTARMERFLHPLVGGPDDAGWPFGRDVYISDVASVLEAVSGVDHVASLNLLVDGTPRGEVVRVPADRIVVAGPMRITLEGVVR